jgi:hypothetical protein
VGAVRNPQRENNKIILSLLWYGSRGNKAPFFVLTEAGSFQVDHSTSVNFSQRENGP